MRLPAKEELCPWTATEKRGPCFLPIFRLETATLAPTRISSLPQGARTRTGHVGSLSRLFLWRALVDTVPTGSQSVVLRPPPRADGVGAEFGGRRVKLGGRSPWPGQGPKCWPCPLYCSLSERPQAHSAKEEVPAKQPMERNPLVSSSSCQRDSRDFFRSTPRNSRPTATFPTVCPNPPKL